MKNIPYLIFLLFFVSFSYSQVVLVGWNDFDSTNDTEADTLLEGFSGIVGTSVSDSASAGAGQSISDAANLGGTTLSYGNLFAVAESDINPLSNGFIINSTGNTRFIDFSITNNAADDYELDRILFHAKRQWGAVDSVALKVSHFSPSSDLSDTVTQRELFSQTGISASTNAFSISMSGLDDYILESGETAAFRIFNENAGANGQFRVDNIAITGVVVPEPTTYALILGIFALSFAIRKKFYYLN
jgi:hypothetical protein